MELQQFKSKKNLLIGLNQASKVETQVMASTFENEGYFVVHDVPAESSANAGGSGGVAAVKSVAVVWDASLSMESVSKKRVLKVLGDLYALPALQGASTSLIVFRQTTEAAVKVANGQELLAKLNAIDYDGGTDLANLRWLGGDAEVKRTCDKGMITKRKKERNIYIHSLKQFSLGHTLVLTKPTYEAGARWNCDGCEFAKDQETESYHCMCDVLHSACFV